MARNFIAASMFTLAGIFAVATVIGVDKPRLFSEPSRDLAYAASRPLAVPPGLTGGPWIFHSEYEVETTLRVAGAHVDEVSHAFFLPNAGQDHPVYYALAENGMLLLAGSERELAALKRRADAPARKSLTPGII